MYNTILFTQILYLKLITVGSLEKKGSIKYKYGHEYYTNCLKHDC